MPSSIGHLLAGAAVSRLSGGSLRDDWPYVLLAATPDLDIILDAMRERPIDYQNRRSHSLGAALGVGAAAGLLTRLAGGRFLASAALGSACYASHLVLDYFGKEATDGLPLLWPFSERRLAADKHVFKTIYTQRGRFFTGLLTRRNLRKIAREVAIVGPFVVAADLARRVVD